MRGTGWVVVLAFALGGCSCGAQQIQVSKDNKTIAVTTSDEASAPADTAVVSVGFQSFGREQGGTYAEAAKVSNAIVSALLSSGVSKEAISSTEQGLTPLSPGNDESKARYAEGMRFQFAQGWQVTVAATDAAKVLQLAVSAGANNSGNIGWQLKDDGAVQAEAAQKALKHARQIAASMAEGLGVRLGGLVYASNQAPPRGGFPVMLSDRALALSAPAPKGRAEQPLAISPQRISSSATVYAVFAIE